MLPTAAVVKPPSNAIDSVAALTINRGFESQRPSAGGSPLVAEPAADPPSQSGGATSGTDIASTASAASNASTGSSASSDASGRPPSAAPESGAALASRGRTEPPPPHALSRETAPRTTPRARVLAVVARPGRTDRTPGPRARCAPGD